MVQTALVTGADRGLGRALTEILLQEGFHVYAGQHMPQWGELSAMKEAFGDRLSVVPMDVSDLESVSRCAERVEKERGSLDVLFNNAAIFIDRSADLFGSIDYDAAMKMYDINALGPLRVAHRFAPLLLKGERKALANISSEAGSVGACWRTKEFGYSMSKSAVNMLSATLKNLLEPMGVTVWAFHPGWVRSYMLGVLNEDATVEPLDSARGLIDIVLKGRSPGDPMYLDYEGNALVW
ncbi:SDR family NAD(P)-dependent oxidoreductase [Paenibacillus thermotolerans]|uniref:SDR family NAD(P)-dependent oxidoreductase n=1 Tax=Paenibacillus thermotolerans TaxID=3027807 RepID=UPI002367F81B|nr:MULTISPECIES: SDR family NAD(P)-dependent oxidoreductase [unclassified Paenibacillus]